MEAQFDKDYSFNVGNWDGEDIVDHSPQSDKHALNV